MTVLRVLNENNNFSKLEQALVPIVLKVMVLMTSVDLTITVQS